MERDVQRILKTLGYWLLIGVVVSWAQETHKAGLWIISTSTLIQRPGETAEKFAAREEDQGLAKSSIGGMQVCLTREMVDNYGVILPPSLKDCELSKVQRKADSFRAEMTCKGAYNGFGSVESTWTDADHVVGKIRFVSKTRGGDGDDARSLRWTQEATAVFKSSDCGAVKPRKTPAPNPAK